MVSILILGLLTLSASPNQPAGQSGGTAPPAKAAHAASHAATDPYVLLRLYDGKWNLVFANGQKPGEAVHLENHCAKAGEFFACNQIVNGKNTALVIFLPLHPLENGGYAYRNQAVRVEGDAPSTWGNLEIVGDRLVYSSDSTDKGKKTYWRTTNVFSGHDKIHFEAQHSDDGANWTTDMSGDEARAK